MSDNVLIATCVGLNFILALIVVLGAFRDRRDKRDAEYDTYVESRRVVPTPRPIPPAPSPPPLPPDPPKEEETVEQPTWPQRPSE